MELIDQQRRRFYDGGDEGPDPTTPDDDIPPDPARDITIVLDRRETKLDGTPGEVFRLQRRIAYDDRHCGEIVVPPRYDRFESDLVSVPKLFTWLVPKTGAHLPAALIHDGLVCNPKEPTYISTDNKAVSRVEADRVFRDAMADTGVGVIRRWLVWTAVAMATMWARDGTSPNAAVRTYYKWIVPVTIFAVAWLGYVATADLFDMTDRWWVTYELRWMGDRPFWHELVNGLAAAIVIPLVLGLLWGTFRRAGMIAATSVGVLLHLTVGLVLVSAVYVALEWFAARVPRAVAVLAGVMVVGGAAAVFAAALA